MTLLRWQQCLLVPQPILTVAYLLAVRDEWTRPAFLPVVLFAAAPLAALLVGVVALRGSSPDRRATPLALLLVALVELVGAVTAAAMIGFAIAWRSG